MNLFLVKVDFKDLTELKNALLQNISGMFWKFFYLLVLPFYTLGGHTEGNPLPCYQ